MTTSTQLLSDSKFANQVWDELIKYYPGNCYAIVGALMGLDNKYDGIAVSKITSSYAEKDYEVRNVIFEICNNYGSSLLKTIAILKSGKQSKGRTATIAPMIDAVAWLIDETGEVGCLKSGCDYFRSGITCYKTKGEEVLANVRDERFYQDRTAEYFTKRKNFRSTARMFVSAFESFIYDAPLKAEFEELLG